MSTRTNSASSRGATRRRLDSSASPRPSHTRGRGAVLALLIFAFGSPLLAQPADLEQALSTYAPAEAARLEALIMQPRWAGFPTDLLVAKAAEGAAKGVSAEMLGSVLHDYASRLDRAHRILGDRATATSLDATADVLEHDVPDETVSAVAAANRKDDQLTASMVALGDLLDAGVPPAHAETLLLNAATQRRGSEDVLHIPALVRRWIRQGYQPTDAAAEVRRTMDLPQRPDGMLDRYRTPPPDRPYY